MAQLRLSGKGAIITGAGGGIGAATAELFCAEGAKVLLVDRDDAALRGVCERIRQRLAPVGLDSIVCDIADFAQVELAVARAVDGFGGLSVLVNNAAIRNIAPIEKTEARDWDALLSVNLRGAANFCKAAVGALRASGNGSVINVSSLNAISGRAKWGIYDATKAALLALTRTFACEEGANGIRVNAVCPAATLTPFTVGRAKSRGLTEEDLRREGRPDNLLGRWARPIEIAYPILWLASDEASFVTGATFMVDAGRSVV